MQPEDACTHVYSSVKLLAGRSARGPLVSPRTKRFAPLDPYRQPPHEARVRSAAAQVPTSVGIHLCSRKIAADRRIEWPIRKTAAARAFFAPWMPPLPKPTTTHPPAAWRPPPRVLDCSCRKGHRFSRSDFSLGLTSANSWLKGPTQRDVGDFFGSQVAPESFHGRYSHWQTSTLPSPTKPCAAHLFSEPTEYRQMRLRKDAP